MSKVSISSSVDEPTETDWLKEAAKMKGLKLSDKSSFIMHNPPDNHLTQIYSSRSDTISADFEWPKISAIKKGFEALNIKFSNSKSSEGGPVNSTFISANSKIFEGDELNVDEKSNNENTENDLNSINRNVSRCNIVFSAKKLLLENEMIRREDVRKEVERKKEDMENFSKNLKQQKAVMKAILAQKRQEEQEKKNKSLQAEEELLNEKMRQNEVRQKHEQQMHKQRIKEQMERLDHEQAEYARLMREKEELLNKVQPCPASFQAKCEQINTLVTSCKNRNMAIIALTPYYHKLKELGQQMEIIRDKTQMGNITINDVNIAEDILQSLDEVVKQYTAETEYIDNAFNAEIARRAYECNQVELQLQTASQPNSVITQLQPQLAPPDRVDGSKQINVVTASPSVESHSEPEVISQAGAESAPQDDLQSYVHPDLWLTYSNSHAYLEQFQITHKEFLQSDALNKFRSDCKKAIIMPLNAINATSREHLTDKYNRVINFLAGKSTPNIGMHPQGITFSIYTMATKIVTNGETIVSSKPEMAFGFASFAVAIWHEYPIFGDMLLAHFRTTCPYVVPVWLPQLDVESKDFYSNLKKQSGVLKLYASIIVSRPRQCNASKSHPHGLGNAWKWLAATLNTEPRADTTEIMATLILDMLEVVGHFMFIAYPSQFPKLLNALRCDFFPKLKSLAKDAGGPVTRLEEFIQKSIASNMIQPPAGLLPPNYW